LDLRGRNWAPADEAAGRLPADSGVELLKEDMPLLTGYYTHYLPDCEGDPRSLQVTLAAVPAGRPGSRTWL
jgi:hypothetical protein